MMFVFKARFVIKFINDILWKVYFRQPYPSENSKFLLIRKAIWKIRFSTSQVVMTLLILPGKYIAVS